MVGCAPPILLVMSASVVVQLELHTSTVLLDSCSSLIKCLESCTSKRRKYRLLIFASKKKANNSVCVYCIVVHCLSSSLCIPRCVALLPVVRIVTAPTTTTRRIPLTWVQFVSDWRSYSLVPVVHHTTFGWVLVVRVVCPVRPNRTCAIADPLPAARHLVTRPLGVRVGPSDTMPTSADGVDRVRPDYYGDRPVRPLKKIASLTTPSDRRP